MPVEYRARARRARRRRKKRKSRGSPPPVPDHMGKITGFLEIDRDGSGLRAGRRARSPFREFVQPLSEKETREPGRALHGLRHSLLSHRLPGEQPDPGLERPRLSRRLAGGDQEPPLDQQFSRVHRAHMPGAVRGVVHAQHHRRAGDDQDHRERHHRSRVGRMAGSSQSRRATRPARGCDHRLRPGRPRLRAATRPRWSRGSRV